MATRLCAHVLAEFADECLGSPRLRTRGLGLGDLESDRDAEAEITGSNLRVSTARCGRRSLPRVQQFVGLSVSLTKMLLFSRLPILKVDLTKWGLAKVSPTKKLSFPDSPNPKLDLTQWGLTKFSTLLRARSSRRRDSRFSSSTGSYLWSFE